MAKQPAKKTATKKTTTSKKIAIPAKKAAIKKVPVKKVPAKKVPVKKVPAKKVPAKKVPAKKAPAKKAPAKKAPAKKAAAKKVPAKKAAAKKAPAKKAINTNIVAYTDIGFGNTLYIRGEGASLSWKKGIAMKNVSATEWAFATTKATGPITFKFLINDQLWAEGDNLTIKAGSKSISSPEFIW